MLRFRPIAPKPSGQETDSAAADQNLTGTREKRKYVRIRARQSKRRTRTKNQPSPLENSCIDDAPPPERRSVTLQLLGERSEGESKMRDVSVPKSDKDTVGETSTAEYGGEGVDLNLSGDGCGSGIVTWIVMEGVTDRYAIEGVGLGFSDKEKMLNLERDTCPGFISDCSNNVIWVNTAYKRMVRADKGFILVVKEEIPQLWPSFACRVRVTQQNGKGQKWNKIVPCDVWRMEFSGFAWKLDVHTALSLGF